MKRIIITALLIGGLGTAQAQQNCNNEKAHHNIVNVNSALETQGYALEYTGSALLSTKAGFAYKLKATKGATFQINMMLPEVAVSKFTITILDPDRIEVFSEKVSKEKFNALLTQTLLADKTGNYVLIINAKGNTCFPLSILKKNI